MNQVAHTPVQESYRFRNFHIPPNMLRSLKRYVSKGARPGRFLCAVLENDLHAACAYADDINVCNLPAYVGYLHSQTDGRCWGTPAKVRAWIIQGGLEGEQ